MRQEHRRELAADRQPAQRRQRAQPNLAAQFVRRQFLPDLTIANYVARLEGGLTRATGLNPQQWRAQGSRAAALGG